MRYRFFTLGTLLLAAVLPRLLSLGTILTIDEPLWIGRSHQFIKALSSLHLQKTLVAGHPGVTATWLLGLAAPYGSLALSQATIALATTVLILTITYGLVRLWGWKWGIIAGFFLALDPFLIAHSRVAHLDALFGLLGLGSIVFLLTSFFNDENRVVKRYLAVSAVMAALTILTKITGTLLLILAVPLLLFLGFRTSVPTKRRFSLLIFWLFITLITIFAVWPTLWVNPLEAWHLVQGVATNQIIDDYHGEATDAWWYYAREGIFRLTPATAALAALAILRLLRRPVSRMHETTLLLVIVGVTFAFAMSITGPKSDRYIIFTLLTISLAAVWGLRELTQFVTSRGLLPVAPAIIALAIFSIAVEDYKLHPYYLAHYNRLYPIEQSHKLGWGEGLEQAADWVVQHDPLAPVATFYPRIFSYFYTGRGSVDSLDHAADKRGAFVVLYRGMFERGRGADETDILNRFFNSNSKPLKIIAINNMPYVWIFKND